MTSLVDMRPTTTMIGGESMMDSDTRPTTELDTCGKLRLIDRRHATIDGGGMVPSAARWRSRHADADADTEGGNHPQRRHVAIGCSMKKSRCWRRR
jgi:hypothetical protein